MTFMKKILVLIHFITHGILSTEMSHVVHTNTYHHYIKCFQNNVLHVHFENRCFELLRFMLFEMNGGVRGFYLP